MKFFDFFRRKKKKVESKKPKIKLGLALGGGGARGFAHLGAIKAFEENGIEFSYIAGTSVGSLVGALYASGLKSDELIEISKKIQKKDIKKNKIAFMPSSTLGIQNLIKSVLGDIEFCDLKIPFCAVAVDIKSGNEVDIKSGNLAKAVAGSCAVPGVFNYVEFDDFRLMDGGLQNTIPSDVVKSMGADYVISVDCNPNRGYGTGSAKLIDLISASIRILMKSNAVKGKFYSNILIEPDTKRFKSSKLKGAEEMIEEGYKATIEKIDEIKKLIESGDREEQKEIHKKKKRRV